MVGTQEVYKDDSLDEETPIDVPLTAKFKRSFAYYTIKDRLPVILTKAVDYMYRDKLGIVEEYGEETRDELKDVIGGFSKLRNELQTNKILVPLISNNMDTELWNTFLEGEPRWFHSPWLLSECYMYRRVRQIFEQSLSLKTFDPFREQKREAFKSSLPAMRGLGDHLNFLISDTKVLDDEVVKEQLFQFIRVSLWGNKCDLSISAGEHNDQKVDILKQLESMEENILANHLEQVWDILSNNSLPSKTVDLVCDNAGFELFTDLCLAELLIVRKLAHKMRFHVKTMPWFVSDVTPSDLHWTLEQLATDMPELHSRWQRYLQEDRWTLHPMEKSYFWTLPCDFNSMEKVDPELFSTLSSSVLTIYKGDLNYRKLMGDLNWRPETPFTVAIRNSPRPLLTLRTLKADVVSGLPDHVADKLSKEHPNWMISGDFAVIQVAPSTF